MKNKISASLSNIWTILGLGVLIVAIGSYSVFSKEGSKLSTHEIARAELISGQAFLIREHQREKLGKNNSIYHLDSIETMELANVLVQLQTGESLRLFENAHITIDKQNKETLVLLKRGEVIVENLNSSSDLFFVQDGKKITASDFQLDGFPFENHSIQMAPHSDPQSGDSKLIAIVEGLIQKNKVQFFRCYSSMLQKKPDTKGEVQITMTVLKNGRINQPQILRSFTEDKAFKNCLLQVISRTDIPAFDGESKTLIVPLAFE